MRYEAESWQLHKMSKHKPWKWTICVGPAEPLDSSVIWQRACVEEAVSDSERGF